MIAQHLAVIGGEDNERIMQLAGLFQRIDHASQLNINQIAHRPICRPQQAMIVFAHRFTVEPAFAVECVVVIVLLDFRFVCQFAGLVVRQGDISQFVQIAFQLVARRIKVMVGIKDVH